MNEKTIARPRSAHAPLSCPAGRPGAKIAHCAIFLRADFGKSCEAVNVNMTLFVFFFLDEKEPKNQGAAISLRALDLSGKVTRSNQNATSGITRRVAF